MELIASPDIPSNFHSILFGQLACILKEEDIPIPRETIYELLSFFKQYYTDHSTEEDKEQEKVYSSLMDAYWFSVGTFAETTPVNEVGTVYCPISSTSRVLTNIVSAADYKYILVHFYIHTSFSKIVNLVIVLRVLLNYLTF